MHGPINIRGVPSFYSNTLNFLTNGEGGRMEWTVNKGDR